MVSIQYVLPQPMKFDNAGVRTAYPGVPLVVGIDRSQLQPVAGVGLSREASVAGTVLSRAPPVAGAVLCRRRPLTVAGAVLSREPPVAGAGVVCSRCRFFSQRRRLLFSCACMSGQLIRSDLGEEK
uniref:Uncharacterized protein n=1 Tax=Oryza glumipatula TaxID=40148 RepID=A0A0E0A993_9ORYZ